MKIKKILVAVGIISFIIFFIFISANALTSYEMRYKTVTGKIDSVEPVIKDNGQIDYLIIHINNETYKVYPKDDVVDLTVHSQLILELSNGYERNFFWEEHQPVDDIYTVTKIIKVPSQEVK